MQKEQSIKTGQFAIPGSFLLRLDYIGRTACTVLFILLSPIHVAAQPASSRTGPDLSASSHTYCNLLHLPFPSQAKLKPKPFLGISYSVYKAEKPIPSVGNTAVLRIDRVLAGSPAAGADIRPNDFIISYTAMPVNLPDNEMPAAFKRTVAGMKPGDSLRMEFLRGTNRIDLAIPLAAAPSYFLSGALHPEVEQCLEPSRLESPMRSSGSLSRIFSIRDGLDLASQTILNPGSEQALGIERLKLPELLWLLRHPLTSGTVAEEISQKLTASLQTGSPRIGELFAVAAPLLSTALPLSSPSEITFPSLLRAIESAGHGVDLALKNLSPDEILLLREHAMEQQEDDSWEKFVITSLKFDRQELFSAFAPLLSFFSPSNLELLKTDLIKRFGQNKGPILYEAETPLGKVIVGGTGPNVYREDAALILDLGGDDLYLNNAGGTRPGIPVALVVDWGGNDRYVAHENLSQGAGMLGGGFLIDIGGDDIFESLDGSQGSGFFGLGLLYHGDGKGTYTARSFSQGVGEMGTGLIVNGAGDTTYLCSLGGQGLGLFGGAGILIDMAGNDLYRLGGVQPDIRDPLAATISMGQGFGQGTRSETDKLNVPGGIGLLVDGAGDDIYSADYFAQGASYYYGLGILDDRGGNDRYIAGRYAQGAGIHSSVGVLIDRKGNDSYFASFGVSQGTGHDNGVGVLEDYQGDDAYFGSELVQGAATNNSLGLLLDLVGSDRYTCSRNGEAFAEGDDGMGILMDLDPAGDRLSLHDDVAPVRVAK